MYMFNLLFNPNRDDGLFEDPPAIPSTGMNAGLSNSKHWLRINGPGNLDAPGGFNFESPGGTGWEDLDQAKTLLIRPNPQHAMFIRIAPTMPTFDPNATLECVAAFGRPVFQKQGFASPFAATRPGFTTQRAVTFFHKDVGARPPGGGWVVRLSLMNRPGPQGPHPNDQTNRYGFAVGVTIMDNAGQPLLSFGEDPEFDVGG